MTVCVGKRTKEANQRPKKFRARKGNTNEKKKLMAQVLLLISANCSLRVTGS